MSEKTTDATGRNDARGRKRQLPWYAWEVLLFGGFAATCVALFGVPSVLCYLRARHDGSGSWGAITAFMGLAALAFVWLCVLGIRMYVTWPKHVRGFGRLLLAWAVAAVVVVLLVAMSFKVWPPGYKPLTWGFRCYVQRRADIPAIQGWLQTIDPNACDGDWITIRASGADGDNPVTSDPEFSSLVLGLKPRYVGLSLDEANRPMISLMYGSGLQGSWGLTVGPEDMPTPATQRREKEILLNGRALHHPGEYRLPLAPGAYVWHDIQ